MGMSVLHSQRNAILVGENVISNTSRRPGTHAIYSLSYGIRSQPKSPNFYEQVRYYQPYRCQTEIILHAR